MTTPRSTPVVLAALVLAVGLAGCSDPAPTATRAAAPAAAPPADTAPAVDADGVRPEFAIADAFVEAFYSFDADRLGTIMAAAQETAPRLLNYQASAFGGNYEVLERVPCFWDQNFDVVCPVTVKDDRVQALGTGFDVTDVFHLTFEDGVLVKVTTSSNDQDIYRQAAVWVRENMPEIMEGPCANRGTPEYTPVECSRAMTRGYEAFVASPDFPGVPPLPKDVKFY
ncbi:MAG: hypothetical protein V2J24_19360 [Pseudomonadales bacterium]|jgi:hypothetical protein|nr:hypothetical protein [Pseudomonadales bacterium]